MTRTHETTACIVTAVDRKGATVVVGNEPTHVTWQQLREAASQSDAELRRIYRLLQRDALALAAEHPQHVEVVKCASGVGHKVRVPDLADVDQLRSVRHDASDGMDHHSGYDNGYALAWLEAAEIARKNRLPLVSPRPSVSGNSSVRDMVAAIATDKYVR